MEQERKSRKTFMPPGFRNTAGQELYWIIEHDELCWAPGEKVED